MNPSNKKANIKNRVAVAAAITAVGIGASALGATSWLPPKPGNESPRVNEKGPKMLPPPGPNPADRSPGTPDPEASSIPVPTDGYTYMPDEPHVPIVEGKSNGVPEAPVPGSAESTKVLIPAQPPKLAFTGPMEITASFLSNDQSTPGHPAVVAGQGSPVNPDIHTPHMSPQPLPFPPVNPN